MNRKSVIFGIVALLVVGVAIYLINTGIKEYMLQSDPMLHTLKNVLRKVYPDIDKLQIYKGEKSYTINKEKVFLCLKDDNGEYYSFNMLIYVLLHEIAHVENTVDVGHTEEFYRKFDELLKKATDAGIYNPCIPIVQNYCHAD